MQVFFEGFRDKEEMLREFSIEEGDLNGCEILFAYYTYQDYSGEAFVVLRDPHSEKFYEVNGSHCSCYGLEGQWEMEETFLDALMKRDTPFFNSVVKVYIEKNNLLQELDEVARTKTKSSIRKI